MMASQHDDSAAVIVSSGVLASQVFPLSVVDPSRTTFAASRCWAEQIEMNSEVAGFGELSSCTLGDCVCLVLTVSDFYNCVRFLHSY